MKKTIAVVFLVFLLSSCSRSVQEAPPPELTGNLFLDAEEEIWLVKGSNSQTLDCYRILVSKDDAISAGMNQFVDFVQEKVDHTYGYGYTICFPDGTGIRFPEWPFEDIEYGIYSEDDLTIIDCYGILKYDEQENLYEYVPSEPDLEDSTPPADAPTGNLFLDTDMHYGAVFSGIGDNILGYYRYIEVNKADALDAGMEQFVVFVDTVLDSTDNWFTVCFDDGTALCFYGGNKYTVEYGTYTNKDYTLLYQYGNLKFNDSQNAYTYTPYDD